MTQTTIRLETGRPQRGAYPVTLLRGDEVLKAGSVNPHKPADIDKFVKDVVTAYPGIDAQDLHRQLLQLASSPVQHREGQATPAIPYEMTPAGIYMRVEGRDGGEVRRRLTNFTATIVSEMVRDDGVEREAAFEIEAVCGGRTERFAIPASSYSAMGWPVAHLGAEAIIFPGTTTKDHARAAIQLLSKLPVPRRTMFTHTGWRRVGGEWVYLHAGGAIGAGGTVGGVQVDLPGAMQHFTLPVPPEGDALREAIRCSLEMLGLAPPHIGVPVFAAAFRAAMGPCDFGLHLSGPSGTFKSEAAALAQQHFGPRMDARHLPGSWHSTDNALEGQLFAGKDAVLVVDDFAPCGAPADHARWHMRADRVFRAQGNNAGRGRMRNDSSLRPPKPPRGLIFSTGEDIPRGQSLRARVFIIEVSPGDIDKAKLTRCQQHARDGRYAQVMAAYVRFLAGDYERTHTELKARVEGLRARVLSNAMHCRTLEIVANLAVGMGSFLEFARQAGAITDAEKETYWSMAWSALLDGGARQAGHVTANEPVHRFLELITSALSSGRAHLASVDGHTPANPEAWGWRLDGSEWRAQGERIGWVEQGQIYLQPDASYQCAQRMGGQGEGLAVGPVVLRKRLDEKGLLVREGKRDTLTVRRVLEGQSRSVLWLAGDALFNKPDIPDIPDNSVDTAMPAGDAPRQLLLTQAAQSGDPDIEHPVDGGNGGFVGKVHTTPLPGALIEPGPGEEVMDI